MGLVKSSETLMSMDDRVWRRHANPWSVWSRVITPLPLLALAIWSRVWLGWGALVPLAAVVLWIWWNPRAFPEPSDFRSWTARGVMGERVYLHHRSTIEPHHIRPCQTLLGVSGLGVLPFAYGLWQLDIWAVITGIAVILLAKMWFVDRMAWVWDDWQRAGRGIEDL